MERLAVSRRRPAEDIIGSICCQLGLDPARMTVRYRHGIVPGGMPGWEDQTSAGLPLLPHRLACAAAHAAR